MKDSILKLREMVESSDNIVFFGGAGTSTESGIKDFRSPDGLYNEVWTNDTDTTESCPLVQTFSRRKTALLCAEFY